MSLTEGGREGGRVSSGGGREGGKGCQSAGATGSGSDSPLVGVKEC